MDIVFDIDGTLANADHRLHFIKDEDFFVAPDRNPLVPRKPDWDTFLSDEQVAKDTPMPQTWDILGSLLEDHHRVIFITGRKEESRRMTYQWLTTCCPVRAMAWNYWSKNRNSGGITGPIIYMRKSGDRRPSHVVKEKSLMTARADGFNPTLVFEDRKNDTEMWRRNGLLCCQVADGNF